MKNIWIVTSALLLMSACKTDNTMKKSYEWPDVKPPVCEKKPKALVAHGDTRIDPYYWLNDYFKKGADSSKVVKYLEAENTYTDTMMSGSKAFENKLYEEMKGRIKEKDESVPLFSNGYYYYNRMEEGKEYFVYCRKKQTLDAKEEILLDVNKMAEGHPYYSAVGFSVSPDNKLMAFGVDDVSRRQYIIMVKNLETGEILKDKIQRTDGNPAWAADNKTIFYVKNNQETLLSEKIMRHLVGTTEDKDLSVYVEKDPSNYIHVAKSKSNKFMFITSVATMSSEVLVLPADRPGESFKVFQPRMKNVLYEVEHLNDHFLILTNMDAVNFRLMQVPLDKTGKAHWTDRIAPRKDVLIQGFEPFKDFLVISERKEGLTQLRVINLLNKKDENLPFDEPAYLASIGSNADYGSKTLRFNYTSLTTPNSVFDFNMETGEKKLKKEQDVLGGFNKNDFETKRLMATASDGSKIPISMVFKKGIKLDGKAPLLLYGYGSYGFSMDATFNSARLSLLNRGFVYAIAHIRGGEEMGREWYENGKLHQKMNTFTDFISCGEYLVKEKYTSPEHMYAMGGSAGGLLMGAITNLRPDLWHGIIAAVPFVDVVTTMSDPTIPLTTNEYDEWGNPANKEDYFYMKSYSPYDNVMKKAYPNMLVTTGLHDSQVQYFEPAKWVAKLRELKTDKNIILLHVNMAAGHGGASGRFKYLKEIALQYTFMMNLEGISQ